MSTPLIQLPFFQDGDFSSPVRTSRTPRDYPFRDLGDVTTAIYSARYTQDLADFVPTAGGTVDPEVAGFYLLTESKPELAGQGASGILCTFTRTYGNVPLTRTTPGNISITRPDPSGVGVAVNSQIRTGAGVVTNLGANWLFGNALFITNALASSYSIYHKVFGLFATTTSANSGGNTRVTWTGHGLTGTEQISVHETASGDSYYLFGSGEYTVVDANTIDLLGFNLGATCIAAAKRLRSYTPGTAILNTHLVQQWYATAAAIPAASSLLTDSEMLTAVIANPTGYVPYSTSSPQLWNGSYLFSTVTTQLEMDYM